MDFKQFNLHPKVQAGIEAMGYVTPTPIQLQAIPSVISGQDVLGLAQTGTGKTAAFGLPMLHRLVQEERGHVRGLVLAPTRELAEQINDALNGMGKQTRLRSVTVYGGVNINTQIKKLKEGAEIVVACPGRLLDHISQGTIDLSRVEILVLDEADQMFDMGFLPDVRKILRALPGKRQNLMFSATMPDDIRRLAHEILRNPVTVQVSRTAPAATVSHALYPVGQHLKTPLLFEMLKHTDTESVLIFTKTKHRAKRVGEQLEKAGYKATSLQGNLSQNRRQAALDGFRDGTFQIMVATDIAARGIDVSLISHVINYDIPDTPEAYTHRIGRTGRAAKTGDAFTMVTSEDDYTVRSIEKVLGTKIERRRIEGFDYAVPAPQKDTEFARPPREPQRRRDGAKPGAGRPAAAGPAGAKPASAVGAKGNAAASGRPAAHGSKDGSADGGHASGPAGKHRQHPGGNRPANHAARRSGR
ncbi:ATP-dependent RNA helicase RhlE [Citrifermentans bemidjiense Bem]|uniref:DEAD-box ATP-dependent RNA helicase RhpA n=1 Tax=Citrifermentans bemidjiense (strain ATCC BAA-1014 / DSM 16622 / JCM 12645 / Bem) TaxID=404380 RepID=B5EAF1_CITBB|nr:DEAD/DEAH box helicase [Citrifermentans bemidjiense]ACH40290.1 ATP-dependent RNA helicase RhlE [Citrifermentans bemidjiense Bem]